MYSISYNKVQSNMLYLVLVYIVLLLVINIMQCYGFYIFLNHFQSDFIDFGIVDTIGQTQSLAMESSETGGGSAPTGGSAQTGAQTSSTGGGSAQTGGGTSNGPASGTSSNTTDSHDAGFYRYLCNNFLVDDCKNRTWVHGTSCPSCICNGRVRPTLSTGQGSYYLYPRSGNGS